jgi:anti-sigma factor RsiW
MHNCKRTRDVLIDLALGELSPAQTQALLKELNNCATCQAEHEGIASALRVSQQAFAAIAPTAGYHARLKARLNQMHNEPATAKPAALPLSSRLWFGLRSLTTSSVRVPVPAAVALLVFAGLLLFSARSRGQSNVITTSPQVAVETRTVHVPVIQERVVTQIVYRDKKRRNRSEASPYAISNSENLAAASSSHEPGKKRFSLAGFKPTDQVNLTIIKGTGDEK